MNTKLLRKIPQVVCVAVLSCATGCGSSNSNDSSIKLDDGVKPEMVRLPNNLWFGKYEVTQAEWEAVMGNNPSKFKNPDNPVENVSWKDCQEFVKKLNDLSSLKKSRLTFRLPTEEEWELACRAGATGDYCLLAPGTEVWSGSLYVVAWFDDNSDGASHPVGQKIPNAWGLYDMQGNVSEWTSTADGERCVIRGGSWFQTARGCESSRRWDHFSKNNRDCDTGFRLCAEQKGD